MGHGIPFAIGHADLGQESFDGMQHCAVVADGFLGIVLSSESELIQAAECTLPGPKHGSDREVNGFGQIIQRKA